MFSDSDGSLRFLGNLSPVFYPEWSISDTIEKWQYSRVRLKFGILWVDLSPSPLQVIGLQKSLTILNSQKSKKTRVFIKTKSKCAQLLKVWFPPNMFPALSFLITLSLAGLQTQGRVIWSENLANFYYWVLNNSSIKPHGRVLKDFFINYNERILDMFCKRPR